MCTVGECKLGQPLWKTAQRCLKTLKIGLPRDPVKVHSGVDPKKTKTLIHKDICMAMLNASLFTIVWI